MLSGVLACSLTVLSVHGLYSASDDVIELNPSNFNREVLQSDSLWLVEFYAPWWVKNDSAYIVTQYRTHGCTCLHPAGLKTTPLPPTVTNITTSPTANTVRGNGWNVCACLRMGVGMLWSVICLLAFLGMGVVCSLAGCKRTRLRLWVGHRWQCRFHFNGVHVPNSLFEHGCFDSDLCFIKSDDLLKKVWTLPEPGPRMEESSHSFEGKVISKYTCSSAVLFFFFFFFLIPLLAVFPSSLSIYSSL